MCMLLNLICSFSPYQDNATPLYVASQYGHHEVVQSLLGSGADVNKAIMPEVSDVMLMPTVHLLVNCYVLFKAEGPLWTASFNGHLNVVEALLAGGANVNQGDKVGIT